MSEPTIFTNVDSNMTIAKEEIFGPVVSVMPYEDEEDAIRIANNSTYGLSGAVFLRRQFCRRRTWPTRAKKSVPATSASTG